MPYISAENVKIKRVKIKKEFPNFKFSITKNNSSGIVVTILEAPFNMLVRDPIHRYEQVNHFYIENMYKKYPEVMNVLLKIKAILIKGQKEEVYDSDYGSVPNFYININIGEYETPFSVVNKKKKNKKLDKKR